MKVKMNVLSAGPNGIRQVGRVYEVSEAEGKELLAGKFAELVPGKVVPAPAPDKDEKKDEKPEAKGGKKNPK